jgi:hypothetical protein
MFFGILVSAADHALAAHVVPLKPQLQALATIDSLRAEQAAVSPAVAAAPTSAAVDVVSPATTAAAAAPVTHSIDPLPRTFSPLPSSPSFLPHSKDFLRLQEQVETLPC